MPQVLVLLPEEAFPFLKVMSTKEQKLPRVPVQAELLVQLMPPEVLEQELMIILQEVLDLRQELKEAQEVGITEVLVHQEAVVLGTAVLLEVAPIQAPAEVGQAAAIIVLLHQVLQEVTARVTEVLQAVLLEAAVITEAAAVVQAPEAAVLLAPVLLPVLQEETNQRFNLKNISFL